MSITNAALAQKITELVAYWRTRDTEYANWVSGAATGGPYADGRFPLTGILGNVSYVKSPAALQASVDGVVDSAEAYRDEAQGHAAVASAAQTAAVTARDLALSYQTGAQAARDLALSYKNFAASHEANAQTSATASAASATAASGSATAADASATAAASSASAASSSATAASGSASAAAASAAAAATFDPANFYTKVQADDRYYTKSVLDVALNAKANLAHTHDYVDRGGQSDLAGWFLPAVSGGAYFGSVDYKLGHVVANALYFGASATNVETALAGKADASHTHSYLPLAGGVLSGPMQIHVTNDETFSNHFEFSQAEGTASRPISIRFHQYGRWYWRLRGDGFGLSARAGATDDYAEFAASRLHGRAPLGTVPELGYHDASTSLSLRYAADPTYGLAMGVTSWGAGWIQAMRADGTAIAYSLALQPRGGFVDLSATWLQGPAIVSDWNEGARNTDSGVIFGRANNSLANSPQNFDNANGYITFNYHAGWYARQFGFIDTNDGLFTRILQNGTWFGWRRIVTLENSTEYFYAPNWIRLINGVGFYTNASDYFYNRSGDGWNIRGGQTGATVNYLIFQDGGGTSRANIAWNNGNLHLYNYANGVTLRLIPNATYGSVSITGTTGGYCGVRLEGASGGPNLMFEAGAQRGGIYNESGLGWILYFDGSQWRTGGSGATYAIPHCTWGTRAIITRATYAPTTEGADGDIWFQYT